MCRVNIYRFFSMKPTNPLDFKAAQPVMQVHSSRFTCNCILLFLFLGKKALVSMTLTVKRPNKDGTCQIFDVKEFKVSNEAYYSIYVA